MKITVIVVTLNRPAELEQCLRCVVGQSPQPHQVIVVDASIGTEPRTVVQKFADVEYARNDNGFGRMTASRNIGLRMAVGDVIAFLDDDSFAHPFWLSRLVEAYEAHPEAGAIGGRALNNQPGEAETGVDKIGRLTNSGRLEGWFAADPREVIEVDHIMGCNMSFRRTVVARLGGFREDYPGISGVREDSDMCLRVSRLGYKLYFTPFAVVTHLGAPQAVGRRFDARYTFYASRNHCVLLLRNFGITSPILYRYMFTAGVEMCFELCKKITSASIRFGANVGGLIVGMGAGLVLLARLGRDPVRHDAAAADLREHLLHPNGLTVTPPPAKALH